MGGQQSTKLLSLYTYKQYVDLNFSTTIKNLPKRDDTATREQTNNNYDKGIKEQQDIMDSIPSSGKITNEQIKIWQAQDETKSKLETQKEEYAVANKKVDDSVGKSSYVNLLSDCYQKNKQWKLSKSTSYGIDDTGGELK